MQKFFNYQKTVLKWIILPVLIVVLIFLFFREKDSEEDAAVEFETETSAELRPVPVEAVDSFIGDLVIRVSATGIVRARQEVTISPKVSGEVVELPVGEGSTIEKGELILKLDDRSYQLALEEAEDNLIKAQGDFVDKAFQVEGYQPMDMNEKKSSAWYVEKMKKEYHKAKALFEEGKIARRAFEEVESWYVSAKSFADRKREANVAIRSGLTKALISQRKAQLDLSYTRITASFSGVLGDQDVFLGQQVSPGKECFKLVDLSKLRVEANTLESEIGDIRLGRKATVRFAAFLGESFPGIITAINPIVDPESKTCRVTVEIDNPELKIKSGMFAFVELEARIHKNRFLVPRDAVLIRDERNLVFVVRENLAKWCYVDTGLENDEYYEVLGSALELKPGEPVVVQGHYTLIHDAPVVVRGRRE